MVYSKKMFFKKIFQGASDMFRRAPATAEKIFQKGKEFLQSGADKAREIAGNVSQYADKASDVLGKIHHIGTRLLDDETVREIARSDPRLANAYNNSHRVVQGAGVGSGLTRDISHITDERNYSKGQSIDNHLDNTKSAIQRAKQIHDDAQQLRYI